MSARTVHISRCGPAVLLTIADPEGVVQILRIVHADDGAVRELRTDERARVHGALAAIHLEAHR